MRVLINYVVMQPMRPQLSVLGNVSGGGRHILYIRGGILPAQMATDNGLCKRSLSVACRHDESRMIKYNNAMLNEFNYLSPVCRLIDVCNEGILCGSVEEVTTQSTEKFGDLDVFEW